METVANVAFIVALVLGVIDLVRSRAESLTAWAVVLICVGLLLPLVT